MIVDRSHFLWALTTFTATLGASVLYCAYVGLEPNGPSGGTWQGMMFGVAGTICMIYAGLLAGRKRVPRWRLRPAQTWLRGHLWVGLLSVPLILFHSGFRWGGSLEQFLMLTFAIVILSGLFGVAVQQVLPRMMSTDVPAQAIAPQIGTACEKLLRSSEISIQKKCGAAFLEPLSIKTTEPRYSPERVLAAFYWDQFSTFLVADANPKHELANPTLAAARFAKLRDSVSTDFLGVVDELQAACDERRQLFTQSRVQKWMHGWLSIHIPLSVTLLVLGILHVFMSLYY